MAWARGLLQSGGFCVLDPETTGLSPPVRFVEIAIVGPSGDALFEGTVRPDCRVEAAATRVHGHTAKSLASSPSFLEAYPNLLETLWGGGSSSTTPPTTGGFGTRKSGASERAGPWPEGCLPGSAP